MKAIVGSRALELNVTTAQAIASIVVSMDPGEPIAIRSKGSPVEAFVAQVCEATGHQVIAHPSGSGGRSVTFMRDYFMVSNCDEVFAFFPLELEMAGGTGHVVKAALDRGIPVRAFSQDDHGGPIYLGSEEALPVQNNAALNQIWEEAHRGG